ncbi:hypothetical protein D9M69_436880 [compost metagenome]
MVSPSATSRTTGPLGLWKPCWLRFFSLPLPRPPRRKPSASSSTPRGETRGTGAFSLRLVRCAEFLRSPRRSSSAVRARSGRRASSFLRASAAGSTAATTGSTTGAGSATSGAGALSTGAVAVAVVVFWRASSSAAWRLASSSAAFRRAASSAARCSSSSRFFSASISSALRLTKVFFLRTSTLMVLLPATRRVLVVLRCKVILRGSSTLSP